MESFFYSGAECRNTFWLCAGEYKGPADLKLISRYAQARYKKHGDDEIYRHYIADALYALDRGNNMHLSKRYSETIAPGPAETDIDPQEIVKRVWAKIRGEE